jgi:hypothetical protein
MVFIQSQGYTDSYGKHSKNIVDLAGQSDYKMSLNPDTGLYDVAIVMGDYEKYLYSARCEAECTKIFQNMLKYHGANEPTLMVEVDAFMIPEVDKESSLEEIEDLMTDVLQFFGYEGLVNAWTEKINEMVDEEESLCNSSTNDDTTTQLVNDTPPSHPELNVYEQIQQEVHQMPIATCVVSHDHVKYRHYV